MAKKATETDGIAPGKGAEAQGQTAGAERAGADRSQGGAQAAAQNGLRAIQPGFKPIAHEDSELTTEQANLLHEKLIEERNRVIDGFRRHVGEVIQDGDQLADELDISARNSEQAYLLRFADKERKLLDEIDHALYKMEVGDYGICEGTSEPISFRRLELRPWTRYSVAFKEQLERWKVD